MATNRYFNNARSSMEQTLIEDLITEAIRMYGHDMWYLPRRLGNMDNTFNEDTLSFFDKAYQLEMYVKNVDGFQGEGDFLSKFGLEVRDEMTFVFSRRAFDQEVKRWEPELLRPNEGDLVYFPMTNEVMQVKFVEHESIFYQLGSLQVWEVLTEQFEYSGERVQTGEPLIDAIFAKLATNLVRSGEQPDFTPDDVAGQQDNQHIQTEADLVMDFSESNPFSEDY